MGKKEDYFVLQGIVLEVLPGNQYRVEIADNNHVILAYLSGKMKQNKIKVIQGDTVDLEVSVYDPNRGRVIFRQK